MVNGGSLKKRVFYFVTILTCFGIYLSSANAAVNFSSNFDNGFDAISGTDKVAYTDATFPSLVAGYDGVGHAIKNTLGTTFKYKTSNLNQNKDSV